MEQEQIQTGIDEQKLFRINKGHNFYNLKQEEKKYFVEVMLETSIDLLEKEEEIRVKTDLPIKSSDWRYVRDYDVVDFLKEIREFVKKPFVKIRTANRKNTISDWKMGDIKDNFRNEVLKFSEIEIDVGKLAEKKLKYDFKKKIKEILKIQKGTDKKIQEQVDRFFGLREGILLLKELIGKDTSSYGYGSYDEKKDDTIRISITTEEYNKQLKEIEKEIKDIAKKLNIEHIGDFDYLLIEKKISFDEWLKINEDDLKENFEDYNDGEYESFDDYAKQMYEEQRGLIEVEWEG